jgi:signal transduction histidine kinase
VKRPTAEDGYFWVLRVPRPVRILAWVVIFGVTVAAGHRFTLSVAGGVLMALAVVGIQLSVLRNRVVHASGALLATACGLAVIPLIPAGLGVIPVLVAASRFPAVFDPRWQRVMTVLTTIGFGVDIGYISQSIAGALAGLVVPLLVQRAEEHRQLIAERDRAQALLAELQATREAESQAAALRERGRIARDMHDVLAHSLAGLSLQLQAARTVAVREGASAEVLAPIETAASLARDGLAEARTAVSALRDPVGLGLDALPALVGRFPGTATLSSAGDAGSLDPEAGHSVYRAVQESLTNAARYAPGAPVAVAIRWETERLRVTVDDTGLPAGREPVAAAGTGLGLAGMAERLRAAGGSVQAGPGPDGGWRVQIEIPR